MRAPTDPPPESAGEACMRERRGRTDLAAAGREDERTATAAVEGVTAGAKTAAVNIGEEAPKSDDGTWKGFRW